MNTDRKNLFFVVSLLMASGSGQALTTYCYPTERINDEGVAIDYPVCAMRWNILEHFVYVYGELRAEVECDTNEESNLLFALDSTGEFRLNDAAGFTGERKVAIDFANHHGIQLVIDQETGLCILYSGAKLWFNLDLPWFPDRQVYEYDDFGRSWLYQLGEAVDALDEADY